MSSASDLIRKFSCVLDPAGGYFPSAPWQIAGIDRNPVISLLPGVVHSLPSTSSIQRRFSANSSGEGVNLSYPSDRPWTPLKPSAPNTPGHCTKLHNGVAATDPDFMDRASRGLATPRTLEIANKCHIVASSYRITYKELMRLNPTLAEQGNGCHLKGMYSYCVSGEGTKQWPKKD